MKKEFHLLQIQLSFPSLPCYGENDSSKRFYKDLNPTPRKASGLPTAQMPH